MSKKGDARRAKKDEKRIKSNFNNSRKLSAFKELKLASLADDSDLLTQKCKFNFAYFDTSQQNFQDFKDWS